MPKIDTDTVAQSLQQWKSEQSNLYSHLCQLISDIPVDTVNGVIHFQRISEYFKKTNFSKVQPNSEQGLHDKNSKQIQYPKWLNCEQECLKSLKKLQSSSQASKSADRIIQNFQKDNQSLLAPIGYSFGSQQSYKIQSALKLLAHKQNAKTLRFFGKINTKNTDYYVIQGQAIKNRQPEKKSNDTQSYGEGVNYYSFWVSHQILGGSDNWYELPMVTPDQFRTSRLIKYLFTGNLKAQIKGYPKFDGQQRHLLKCQLVRIVHNCEIVPNNLYAKNQQNPDVIDFAEQFKMSEFTELTNLQNWVHLNPYILQSGRYRHFADPKLSPQEKDELMGKLSETDPPIERLKQINQDKPIQKLGLQVCWFAKQTGNLQLFNNVGKDQGSTSCYGSVVLKNPHWPGWVTTANNKNYVSIYIGYGYKLTQNCFYPMTNEDLLIEGEDNDEVDQPNPRDPPDQLEPDSDDEIKKQAD